MYEGSIRAAEHAGGEESPILRQLRWTDLVARLAATREVRPLSVDPGAEPHASFAAFQRDGLIDGQERVNRDALTHGKLSRVITPDAADDAGNGDRETQ